MFLKHMPKVILVPPPPLQLLLTIELMNNSVTQKQPLGFFEQQTLLKVSGGVSFLFFISRMNLFDFGLCGLIILSVFFCTL